MSSGAKPSGNHCGGDLRGPRLLRLRVAGGGVGIGSVDAVFVMAAGWSARTVTTAVTLASSLSCAIGASSGEWSGPTALAGTSPVRSVAAAFTRGKRRLRRSWHPRSFEGRLSTSLAMTGLLLHRQDSARTRTTRTRSLEHGRQPGGHGSAAPAWGLRKLAREGWMEAASVYWSGQAITSQASRVTRSTRARVAGEFADQRTALYRSAK